MVISWVSCNMRWACFCACSCPCQVSWLPYSTDSYFHDFVFVSVSYIKKSKLQIWKAQQGNLLMSGEVNTSWSHQWQLRRASCFSHPAGKQPCHHQPHHLQEPEHPGLPLHQHQGAPRNDLLQGAPHTWYAPPMGWRVRDGRKPHLAFLHEPKCQGLQTIQSYL